MALVEKLEEQKLERRATHKPVRCSYWVVTEEDGVRLLQLDTYGSQEREMKDKKSQSLRFSPVALRQLLAIAKQENLL